jgi:hypothetical protein
MPPRPLLAARAALPFALFAACLLAAAPPQALPDFCFDPTTRHVCVSDIAFADGNWSWTMSCRPLSGDEALDWCGIGFRVLDTAPPARWSMFPSEVIVLQVVDRTGGGGGADVIVEDRFARIADQPDCNDEQLTFVRAFEVDPAPGGGLRATLTRQALVSEAQLEGGYTSLNRTMALIAAFSSGNPRQTDKCGNDNFFAHDMAWRNTTLDMTIRA